jgi:hypothetical protein
MMRTSKRWKLGLPRLPRNEPPTNPVMMKMGLISGLMSMTAMVWDPPVDATVGPR